MSSSYMRAQSRFPDHWACSEPFAGAGLLLISADLFACGLATIVQSMGFPGVGIRLPVMMGVTFDQASLTRGLRADGVGTILGGVFNTFPYTSFSQNVGLVGVTHVPLTLDLTGGVLMLVLGLLPKMSALVEAVPKVVLRAPAW
jgi:uric acid transporter